MNHGLMQSGGAPRLPDSYPAGANCNDPTVVAPDPVRAASGSLR